MASAGTSNMTNHIRKRTLWVGANLKNFDVVEFERRGLSLEIHDGINARNEFATTRGIILKYNPEKQGTFKRHIEDIGPLAIDHGVMIYAIADDVDSQQRIEEILKQTEFKDHVYQRTNPPSYEVAERIARHKPGPPPNSALAIRCEGINLDETTQCFFKRAFWDCSSIQIQQLDGGRSANAFSVHAVFQNSLAGPRPLPFFAKIDDVRKIKEELDRYQQYVFHFIPFNLRPDIDSYRCILGHQKGIIVGNFVERSESLWDALRRGNARTVIYSLFENALHGWRMQAKQEEYRLLERIGSVFEPSRVSRERLEVAHKYGANKSPHELNDILARFPSQKYLHTPIHGDLHVNNVRVRENDAILIDFALTRLGPLVADPASLEVSLAFEIAGKDDDDPGWQELMDVLYSTKYLEQPPPPAREPRPREWLWNAVRQIRLFALSEKTSDCEYSSVIALYLLRRSMYLGESDSDNFRRAYAYVLAEKIILDIAKKLGVYKP